MAATTPPRWTDADTATLKDLHAAGRSLHSIAKEMGRSKDTISKYAARAGLSWSRERTAAAAAAKVADAKDRRAALQLRALSRAEALYDRLEADTFATMVRDQGGSEKQATLSFVPARDERDLAATIKIHLDTSLRLAQHDADDRDLPAVDKWLAFMTGGETPTPQAHGG